MNVIFSASEPALPAISHQIWQSKYRLGAGEATLQDSFWRVAKSVAAAEKPEERERWATGFYELMADLRFLPAGRILAGAGTGRDVTLFNCFVMGKIADSIPGIFNALNEAAQTLQQGGGIGHDFSSLRPKGALVHGVGAEASGPLSFMDVWDAMCRTIMSAGARRGAMMGTLRCDHPDIEAFVEAKRDKTKLRNFNLSVLVTDRFMAAVGVDADWPLQFEGVVFKTVSARELWGKIMQATYDCAEPGVIFIDRINAQNPLRYCETISCTNPCGEQPLPAYGACLLGSLNLTRFVDTAFEAGAAVNFEALRDAAKLAVRFLDDVIDVSQFPLPAQKNEALNKRRLGLGITGLADALVMCGRRYGSDDAAALAAQIAQTIRDAALEASADLAVEKGAFPLFDAAQFLQTDYARGLDAAQRHTVSEKGLRNGLLTSIAPTGTISLLAGNVSSGIEPVFSAGYERKIINADGSHRTEKLEDYAIAMWRRRGALVSRPPGFVTVDDLTPQQHLQMAAAVQPFIDSSISKTINVAQGIGFGAFTGVYELAYTLGLKGCTTFRPNDITGSVLLAPAENAQRCPACDGTHLVHREGCTSCTDCGFALCG
jgi:ribonucleoside-diphosphate reductase alpha chain